MSVSRRRIDLLLGLLVVVIGIACLTLLGSPQSAQDTTPGNLTVSLVPVGAETAAETSTYGTGSSAASDPLGLSLIGGPGDAAPAKRYCGPNSDPSWCDRPINGDLSVLPAWRWTTVWLDMEAEGLLGPIKEIPNTIAMLLFNLANFMWRVLLALLRIGFNARDLLRLGTGAINSGFAFLSGRLLFVAVPAVAFAIWRVAKAFFATRNGSGVFAAVKTFVGFFVGFSMLFLIFDRSEYAVETAPRDVDAQLAVSGTLPWGAYQLLNMADRVTNPLVSTVMGAGVTGSGQRVSTGVSCSDAGDTGIIGEVAGDANGDGVVSPGEGFDPCNTATVNVNTCANYLNALHQDYLKGPGNERTLVLVSRLWEGTLYDSWKSAGFGSAVSYTDYNGNKVSSDVPERVMCHWAEAVNNRSVRDQFAFAQAAYGDAMAGNTIPFVIHAASNPYDDTHALRRAMTMWAACTWNGSAWVGHPDFDGAWVVNENAAVESDDIADTNVFTERDLCSLVMATQEGGDDGFNGSMDRSKIESLGRDQGAVKKLFYVFGDSVSSASVTGVRLLDISVGGDPRLDEQMSAVRSYGYSFTGQHPGERIVYALVSVIVAGLFIFSLGFIGVGLVAAVLMAIAALIIAIPLALVLTAIGKSQRATPLYRITLSSLLAHNFFTIILAAIVILTGIFHALITGIGGIGGMVAALLRGGAPLAAFYIVKKMLQSLGMSDILSPAGALTFAGSAALQASGDSKMKALGKTDKSGRNAMQQGLSKIPGIGKRLDKMDRMAPTPANWSKAGRERRRKLSEQEKKERQQKREERDQRRAGARSRADQRQERIDNRKDRNGRAWMPWTRARKRIDQLRGSRGPGDLLRDGGQRLHDIADEFENLRQNGFTVLGAARERRARRAMDTTVDFDNAVDMDATPGEVIGGAAAGPQADANRQQLRDQLNQTISEVVDRLEVSDPSSSQQDRIQAAMNEVVENMFATFTQAVTGQSGTLTLGEVDGLRINLAGKLNLEPENVMGAMSGIIMPRPFSAERARAELDRSQLGYYMHWLSEEDRQVQQITVARADGTLETRLENDEEYIARQFVIGVARGGINPDGSYVDILAAHGIGDDLNGQARTASWKEGNADSVLDNLRLDAVDSALEEKLIQAARQVVQMQQQALIDAAGSAAANASYERFGGFTIPVLGPVSPVTGTAAAPAVDTKDISQLVLAVNAARELVDTVRATNGNLVEAAGKMTASMERLESSQERLVSSVGEVMTDALEKQLAAMAATPGTTPEQIEETFLQGVDRLEEAMRTSNAVLEDFKSGLLGLDETLRRLNEIVRESNRINEEQGEILGEMKDNWSRPAVRSSAPEGVVSAKAVAEQTGKPVPGE